MGPVSVLLGVALAQSAAVTSFSAPVTYYDVEYGSTLVLDGDHWEFRIIGRKGFLRMLSEIHDNAGYHYEVRWGNPDVLRVKRTDKETDLDLALRRVLPALGLTYRIDRGIYNIVPRPIPQFQDYGLEGPDESGLGKRSLDALARCLCQQGIGYRVEGARSSVVNLTAPFASAGQTIWIVQELDTNLDIDTRNGIVVRPRFYYR